MPILTADSFSRDDSNPLSGNWQSPAEAGYSPGDYNYSFASGVLQSNTPIDCSVCGLMFVAQDTVYGESGDGGPMVWRHMGCEPKA